MPGLECVYPGVRWRWARRTRPDGYRLVTNRNLLLVRQQVNDIDRRIAFCGDVEHEQLDFLVGRSAGGLDAFLEVGTNSGPYALQVARAPRLRRAK